MNPNTDPVTDSSAPRHAIESDSEDESFNPQSKPAPPADDPSLSVKIVGDLPINIPLVIVTGEASKVLTSGALSIGKQSGGVGVGAQGTEVGLAFNPSWTSATILVSEALTRLPLSYEHVYVQTILETLKPSKISLLDSYSVPSYVPRSGDDAPIRFLPYSAKYIFGLKAKPFEPPNMLQYTSALFLSVASVMNIPATLVVLPSPTILPPPPSTIPPIQLPPNQDVPWPVSLNIIAEELIFQSIGEVIDGGGQAIGSTKTVLRSANIKSTPAGSEIGEGGMYI